MIQGIARVDARVRSVRVVVLLCLLMTIGGCGQFRPRNAVPQELSSKVYIEGMNGVKFWGDILTPEMEYTLSESWQQERRAHGLSEKEELPATDFLALSGGGADGAFGAGLLCGWSELGTRPDFKLVTGISTGALIAPFAFLGPAYDAQLKEVYTTVSRKDIFRIRDIISILRGDAVGDNSPLQKLAARYVTKEVLRDIAREHAKGRRLFVGTTNLDVQRPVIWDMGAIASSNSPDALELFRQVLVASASIPVAFPPAYVKVTHEGKTYDEMHVDGGTAAQVFLYPSSLDLSTLSRHYFVRRGRRAFVIRNSRLAPQWEATRTRVHVIGMRSIATLIKTQGVGDLYRIYAGTQRDGIGFNLAYIPDDCTVLPAKEEFDREYMNALFEYGRRLGSSPDFRWQQRPTGMFENPYGEAAERQEEKATTQPSEK